MIPVETIPGMEGRGNKEEQWRQVNSCMIYKNFCKCHNVPLPSKIKEKMEKSIKGQH
jgi:hypothetical protein